MSDMMKLSEQYLIQIHLSKDNFYKHFFLIRELTKRGQQKISIKKIGLLLKQLDNEMIKDEDYFDRRYLLENEKPGIYRSEKSLHHIEDENTPQIIENRLISFFITILKLNAYMLNKIKFINEYEYNKTFLDEALAYLENKGNRLLKNFYINFYYNVAKLFITEKENYYFELRKIAESGYDNLNETDKKNVYVVLANYCSAKIAIGEFRYYMELFGLYKDILVKGAHYEGFDYFSHILFKKMIIVSLEVNELEWAEHFLAQYSGQLNEIYRDSNINLAKAFISFKKKDYDHSLEHLSRVQIEDSSYKEEIKVLEIKIFFEAGYQEQFYSAVDRFRHFINSAKDVSERRRPLYLEFVNYAIKLFRISESRDKDFQFYLTRFKDSVINNKNCSNKKWLIEKATEQMEGEL